MSIAYGIEVKPDNDPWVSLAEAAIKPLIDALVPGAFLVDSIPLLRYVPSWMPGAGFKRKAMQWKELNSRLVNYPFVAGKEILRSGEQYAPSFISVSLQKVDEDSPAGQENEILIRHTAGAMYTAGVDT
ncbi:hypothetical protein MPER_09282, partial [Moniliophthora perniciosa FA553]